MNGYVHVIDGPATAEDLETVRRGAPRLAHQPALDGLRALAVLAVLVFHQHFVDGFGRGGFLGVDIFFVLSGYLITSLLLIDHAKTGRVISLGFWARRVRRLFPALLLLLAISAAYGAFVAKPWELHASRAAALATLFYVNNFWQMVGAHRVATTPLDHTWSLSIEEQFYFVWPLLLASLLFLTRGRRRWLFAGISMLAVASAVLMAVVYEKADPWRAYLGTDTRAHSLLVGAALGVAMLGWSGPRTRAARVVLEAAGVAAFVFLIVVILRCEFFSSSWLYRGGYLLVAIASATVIAAAVQAGSPVLGRGLAARPLVAVGLISYGIYLFHLPVFMWLDPGRVGFDGLPLFAVRVAVTLAVAIASYFLVERPIRRGTLAWPRLRVLAPAATAGVIVLVLLATVGAEPAPTSVLIAYQYRNLVAKTPRGAVRVLVVGDNAAFGLGLANIDAFFGNGLVGTTASVPDCGIGSGEVMYLGAPRAQPDCRTWPNVFRNGVENFAPQASVLLLGTSSLLDRSVGGRTLHIGTPEFATYFTRQLEQARAVLTAGGAPLVLLTVPCSPHDFGATAPLNALLRRFAAAHPSDVSIGDYGAFMCPGGTPRAAIGGHAVRQPDQLLTRAGAAATWDWLAHTPTIAAQVRTSRALR
jgi:peptidoglycan/LPS O-acetylase OafA/YrhL